MVKEGTGILNGNLDKVSNTGSSFITVQMMRSVLGVGHDGANGTGRAAAIASGVRMDQIEIGGKTGSGPEAVWMMSVSPRLVIAVLLTYQCHSEIRNSKRLFAADTAALIWARFTKSVARFRPDLLNGRFPRPSDVIEAKIDPKNGCRTTRAEGIREYFLKRSEPPSCAH